MSAASNSEQQPTISQIAASFVAQYYSTFTKDPSRLFKYYKNESRFTYEDGVSATTSDSVHGVEQIKNKIASLDFNACKAKLQTVDAQQSLNGSLLVVVHGLLSSKGSAPRKFTQTFFLAVQEKGYYVLNDIFRFLDPLHDNKNDAAKGNTIEEKSESPVPSPSLAPMATEEKKEVEAPKPQAATKEPATAKPETVAAPVPAAAVATTTTTTAPASKPNAWKKNEPEQPKQVAPKAETKPQKPAQQPQHHEERRTTVQQAQKAEAEKARQQKPKGPITYASIVGGDNYVPVEVPLGQAEKTEEKQAEKPASKKSEKRPSKRDGNAEQRPPKKENKREIFVSNVAATTTTDQIMEVFSKFGKVSSINNKAQEKAYAFVVFETVESAETAVREGANVELNGKAVKIDERKTNAYRPPKGDKRPIGDDRRRSSKGNNRERKDQSGEHQQLEQPTEQAGATDKADATPKQGGRGGSFRGGRGRGDGPRRGGRGGRGGFNRANSPKQQQQSSHNNAAPGETKSE